MVRDNSDLNRAMERLSNPSAHFDISLKWETRLQADFLKEMLCFQCRKVVTS